MKTRVWARGITTTYTYQNGQQTNIDYSDNTPDVAITYDNFGRLKIRQPVYERKGQLFVYMGDFGW